MAKKRNPVALVLRQSTFKMKVVKSKKQYDRKKIAGRRPSGDYRIVGIHHA